MPEGLLLLLWGDRWPARDAGGAEAIHAIDNSRDASAPSEGLFTVELITATFGAPAPATAGVREEVKEYYGKVLQKSTDLQTNACCTAVELPTEVKEAIRRVHPEVCCVGMCTGGKTLVCVCWHARVGMPAVCAGGRSLPATS